MPIDKFGIPTIKPIGNNEIFGVNKQARTSRNKTKKKSKTRSRYIPKIWKEKILKKQRNFCAGKDCAKLHNGRKLKIDMYSHFDHIRPLGMNGDHKISNIQALCPGCHQAKKREDRHKISEWKKKYEKKTQTSATKKPTSRRKTSPWPYDLGFKL